MDELFTTIGKLYTDLTRMQGYIEILQNKVKELEAEKTTAPSSAKSSGPEKK
jgi:hypothetical protein